jgi:hypothetical protein
MIVFSKYGNAIIENLQIPVSRKLKRVMVIFGRIFGIEAGSGGIM